MPAQETPRRRSSLLVLVVLLVGSLVVFGLQLAGRAHAVVLPAAEFERLYRQEKTRAIAASQGSTPWWAGEYYSEDSDLGDVHSSTLVITSNREYFSEIVNCVDPGPQFFGTVRVSNAGRLHFQPTHGRQPFMFAADPNPKPWAARLVRWGERVYLVGDYQLSRFEQAVEQGLEPRSSAGGEFSMRRGDWNKPATGKPDIPN